MWVDVLIGRTITTIRATTRSIQSPSIVTIYTSLFIGDVVLSSPTNTRRFSSDRFDMNSGNIRRKFAHVFTRESATGNPDHIATPPIILTGSSTRGTAGIGMGGHMSRRRGSTQERNVTGCRRALFALDPKNADGRLFLVLQLSKVLQGEPEKVGC